jgi:putative PEP-CTERM system TPR-repeat lipoprotein
MNSKRLSGRVHKSTSRAAWTALLAAFVVAGCGTDPAADLGEAQANFEAGNLRVASIHVSNLLQANPNDAVVRVLRGRIALASGNPDLARGELERARELGAEGATVVLPLSEALTQLGDAATALELLDALPDDARNTDYWLTRGEALLAAGRLEEAATALQRSRELAGRESTRYLVTLAGLSERRGEAENVPSLLDRAVEQARLPLEMADALAMRGGYFARLRRLDEAASDLQQAIDLYSQSVPGIKEITALSVLAEVHLTRNDLEAAQRSAARLAARAPGAPLSAYVEGVVAYRSGSYSVAVTKLQQAVNAAPETPMFRAMLGAAHLAQGNFGQAEQQLRPVVSSAPGDVNAVKLLSETYLRQGRPSEALEALRALPPEIVDAQVDVLRSRATAQNGDVQAAVGHLEQAVARNPDEQALKLELARTYLAVGRDDSALELLSGLLGGDEALNANLMALFAHLRSGNTAAGLATVADLTQRFPEEPRVHAAAAMFHSLTGDEANAESSARNALNLDGTLMPARLLLVSLLMRQNRAGEAEQVLAAALELEPANPLILTPLAQLAGARGDFARAEFLLAQAAEAAPEDPAIRRALGEVKLRQNDSDGALAIAESLQTEFPALYHGYLLEGYVHLVQRRYAEAVGSFDAAFMREPEWPILALQLRALRLAGRTDEERRRLQAWLAEHPDSLDGRLALADALQTLGRLGEALAEYERVLDSSPDNVVALNNAAWLVRERDAERALGLAARAGALAPNNPAVLDTWGWILAEADRPEEAVIHLQRAAELAPNVADIQYHYAYVLNDLDRKDDARRVLQALLARPGEFASRAAAQALLATLSQ